jgi:hypothetical protein
MAVSCLLLIPGMDSVPYGALAKVATGRSIRMQRINVMRTILNRIIIPGLFTEGF